MKRKKMRHAFIESDSTIRILFCILVTTFLVSCGTGTRFVRTGTTYPPYTGEIRVFWKDHGVQANTDSYKLIGTVSGSSQTCGIATGRFNERLHKELIEQAGKYGGNGVILYCGEPGSPRRCDCWGDVIRF